MERALRVCTAILQRFISVQGFIPSVHSRGRERDKGVPRRVSGETPENSGTSSQVGADEILGCYLEVADPFPANRLMIESLRVAVGPGPLSIHLHRLRPARLGPGL